ERLLLKGHSRSQLALIYDVSPKTIYKYFPAGKFPAERISESLTDMADEQYHNERTIWEQALEEFGPQSQS
ncbi:TPA: helix-turn-helix domain-containing protein, partial [Salmonella enterica subsp. enterica serovar Saintpaul str. CFSAN004147]|nr:helix-turn-helix domain-containing protein [Salmonella enterica subsp. enterica serovar Saintpaul str. CFSAN004147]